MNAKALTRTAVLLAVIFGAIFYFSTPSAEASSEAANVTYHYVSVQPGQTLWTIAAKYAGDKDSRDYMAELISLNNLTEATLMPGQRIALPNN
jgi:LysM repeat protein